MRQAHKNALRTLCLRSSVKEQQLDDICLVVASTYGPLVIAAMIERGLQIFRETKRKRRKGAQRGEG